MIEFKNFANFQTISLTDLSQISGAAAAANLLWSDVHQQARVHGGRALIRTPEDGENGFLIFWEGGPENWAIQYVAHPGNAETPLGVEAVDGLKVRLTDQNESAISQSP